MASPFTRYQGEQVQQINILPYTAGIAENIRKGIADIGEGIGAYQNFQAKKAEEKGKATYLANSVLQQYMEQDGPEDDATGEISYKPKDTAPQHIVELWKKSQKQPDGVEGLASTDLTSFLTVHAKYEQDDAIAFDRRTKEAGIDLQKAQLGLAEREFGLRQTANEQDYKFKLRDLEWRIGRGEKGDELDALKLQLERDRLGLEKSLGPARLKLLEAEARVAGAKATSTERALSAEEARELMIQARQGIVPTEKVTVKGEKVVRSGFLETPDNQYDWYDDIDKFLKESGLKVEDVTGTGEQKVTPFSTTIARTLSGDAQFDPTIPAVNNTSKNKKQFVQGVYEQLIKNFPEQRATIDHQFKWNAQAKGENKEVELDTARYDIAVKYANTQQFQDAAGKSLGIKPEVAKPVPRTPPTGVKIISEEKTTVGTSKEIVAYKTDQRMVDEAYDSAFTQFRSRNLPFPMTRDDAYKVFGLFGGMKRWQTETGKVMYTNEKGETKSQDELEGMGLTRTPTTEAGMKRQGANNYFRQFVGEGKTYGNYVFRAKTTNKEDPMSEMPIINAEDAQKELTQLTIDIDKADKYIDKMVSLWKEKKWYENLPLFGAWWDTEYTTYQRGLETFRKNFIAPGTETEKDAMRLGDMMAEPSFWRNLQEVDKTIDTLELTRSLIADSAKVKADAIGIEIKPTKGLTSTSSKEQAAKRIEQIVLGLKDKYPDIYNKYNEPKK
jgi:hypothetical protein